MKKNAIAGRRFDSWSGLEAHLVAWTRDVADCRVHGTTGEPPAERFVRDEARALKSLAGIPPFLTARDLIRRVGSDCTVEVDGNAYSVPWRLIGERVHVSVSAEEVRISYAGHEVASHTELKGRRGRSIDERHFEGVTGSKGRPVRVTATAEAEVMEAPADLLRPLSDYEAVAGGAF